MPAKQRREKEVEEVRKTTLELLRFVRTMFYIIFRNFEFHSANRRGHTVSTPLHHRPFVWTNGGVLVTMHFWPNPINFMSGMNVFFSLSNFFVSLEYYCEL
jgi:hypothetical protein